MLRRRCLRALIFLGLLAVAGWPWPALQVQFSRVLSALANVCLSRPRGAPLQIELLPLALASRHGSTDNVQADTQMVLRLARPPREARLGLSLRRDVYLPLLIFAAAILVLPLPRAARLRCLALGIPLVLAVAILSVAILARALLGDIPGAGIIPWQTELCQFLFEIWLTPPGNRVIAPLLLAAVLALSAAGSNAPQRRRVASAG